MTILVIIGILIAKFHYDGINKSEDPRITEAKQKYQRYDALIEKNDLPAVLQLLDSIEAIYTDYPDYRHSYEVAVIYNNRAAVYLTKALHNTYDKEIKDSLLNLAHKNTKQSIAIYESWLSEFGDKSEDELREYAYPIYHNETYNFDNALKENYLEKRVKDLTDAQKENTRRLSVSYTNKGIIHRHKSEIDSAITAYKYAIDLWEDNYTARNNLNMLLNRPLEKQSILRKLFPKSR